MVRATEGLNSSDGPVDIRKRTCQLRARSADLLALTDDKYEVDHWPQGIAAVFAQKSGVSVVYCNVVSVLDDSGLAFVRWLRGVEQPCERPDACLRCSPRYRSRTGGHPAVPHGEGRGSISQAACAGSKREPGADILERVADAGRSIPASRPAPISRLSAVRVRTVGDPRRFVESAPPLGTEVPDVPKIAGPPTLRASMTPWP